jgi:hypothetical protein
VSTPSPSLWRSERHLCLHERRRIRAVRRRGRGTLRLREEVLREGLQAAQKIQATSRLAPIDADAMSSITAEASK